MLPTLMSAGVLRVCWRRLAAAAATAAATAAAAAAAPQRSVSKFALSMNPADVARDVFAAAVQTVQTDRLVKRVLVTPAPDRLLVNDRTYELKRNVHVVAFGKAVLGMVRAAEDVLGSHIVGGVASVPHGLRQQLEACGKEYLLPRADSTVRVIEGAENNQPDSAAQSASAETLQLLQGVGEDDIVLALVSGGGSALLPLPVPPVQLDAIRSVTVALSRAGASITELNTVRKQLELLKGGGLARMAYPAKVIALVLSDIVGDPLDFIASGPTVEDVTTAQEASAILARYLDPATIPMSIRNLLSSEGKAAVLRRMAEEKLSALDGPRRVNDRAAAGLFDFVHNVVVGSNADAMMAAADRCRELGLGCLLLTRELQGEARDSGVLLAQFGTLACLAFAEGHGRARLDACSSGGELSAAAREYGLSEAVTLAAVRAKAAGQRGLCLLAGGETTVTVRGQGRGGRNQEMALAAAAELARLRDCGAPHLGLRAGGVAFLSAGTDGQDGPTDVAGACVTASVADGFVAGKKCSAYLRENDSYNFFAGLDSGRHFVRTGLTGTNVMDVQVLVISY